jgi:hypothetical protein
MVDMNLIEKIENLKINEDDLPKAITLRVYEDWVLRNRTINTVLAMPEIQATQQLIEMITEWWDKLYPEDIFDGSSGDDGAVFVSSIRELLKKVNK